MRMVALPRGINVGGRVVPMARLRALLESAGFSAVRTVLASGNVAFDAPPGTTTSDDDGVSGSVVRGVRQTIERLMSEEFGYDAIVQVYPAEAVARCVTNTPWGDAPADVHHYLVLIDDDGVRDELLAAELDSAVEAVAPAELGVHWRVSKGQTLSSGFAQIIGSARVKRHVTTRKVDTLRKLLA